jgi:hypothetical protein
MKEIAMALLFYGDPFLEEGGTSSYMKERLEQLKESAERYKAVVLESTPKSSVVDEHRSMLPKDLAISYNWEAIAIVLREIREMPENSGQARHSKAEHLMKLSEIYEILRAAKMSKLEAVRVALMTEANQLRGGSAANVA